MVSPSYIKLAETGELANHADELMQMLECCRLCPRECRVNRLKNYVAACFSGLLPIVSSYTPHFGEEPGLVGKRGSGTVFLGLCTMRCVFCQNYEISQAFKEQRRLEVTFERLAEIFLELQAYGCHNINWVSPTHFAPQLVRALLMATEKGFHLPIVYNTNGYDSLPLIKLLEGIVDIYLPDLKYSEDGSAREYSKVRNYVAPAREAINEMFRQVGSELIYGKDGEIRRGLIIRLLALPNDISGLGDTLHWIASVLSPKITISLMSQYYPANKVSAERYPLLSRRLRLNEWIEALDHMESAGLTEGWIQDFESASGYYRPDFKNEQTPFKDVTDFES